MLRVCGVTFDHTANYGSSLQAYALQSAVENITLEGGEPCSYNLYPAKRLYDKSIKPLTPLKFKVAVYHAMLRRFTRFEHRRMHYVECSSSDTLSSLNDCYDAFVCGSDVIWNIDFTQADPLYFLGFAEKYKFSYAASFGVSDIEKDFRSRKGEQATALFRRYLPRFDRISVREPSAVSAARSLSGKDAEVVCDPTLLMTADRWRAVFSHIPPRKKKYIFVYTTHMGEQIQKLIDRLHKSTGLEVVNVVWSTNPSGMLKNGQTGYIAPDRWLSLIAGAEYVVTNSFHATLFSVMFHKRFFTVVNGDKAKGINVRMHDFLTSAGLQDRLISQAPDEVDLDMPDFTQADSAVEETRARSLEYLRENLEAAARLRLHPAP